MHVFVSGVVSGLGLGFTNPMGTSIVSRHLATRGSNKILRAPPPYISRSEEIFPHLTRRTLAQLSTYKSSFLKSYLHKVDAESLLCSLCDTHIIS